MHEPVHAALGTSPEAYARLGISRDHVEPHEDGMRTDGSRGTYEWWYFDAHLTDGSKLVIACYTKEFTDPGRPMAPYADLVLDRPDGTHVATKTKVFHDEFSAAGDRCDVRIGPNRFTGDLHDYAIHIETDQITADVVLTGQVPAWRPATGHLFFEEDEHLYFAWLPAVPKGHAEVTLTTAEQRLTLSGIGYHDHNWGNVALNHVVNNWYWGRGGAGPYALIACFITAEERYGYATVPIFMLARDGEVVADDHARVTFSTSDIHDDPVTHKPAADVLTYTHAGDGTSYRVTWHRQETILQIELIDEIHGLKHLAARLLGFDGGYMRFAGDLCVEQMVGGATVEVERDDAAIWELMYFGHGPDA